MACVQPVEDEWEQAIGDTLTRTLKISRENRFKNVSKKPYSSDHIEILGRRAQALSRTEDKFQKPKQHDSSDRNAIIAHTNSTEDIDLVRSSP